MACELMSGQRELPGGPIHSTGHWVLEHCVGPLGAGTLIVKPKRHITHVWDLSDAEAVELGPLLKRSALALSELLGPEQVYACLWSHSGGTPVHIHWVLQPVGPDRQGDLLGPHLQSAMFDGCEYPPAAEVEAIAGKLRVMLAEP